MKKITVLLLAAVMTAMSVFSAWAVPLSPHHDPKRREYPDGHYILIYTPYAERDTIKSQKSRDAINAAYGEIMNCSSLIQPMPVIATKIQNAGLTPDDCYVGDLFDLTYYYVEGDSYTEISSYSGTVRLNLPDDKDGYICLVHRKNGVWTNVDARWEGDDLVFNVNGLSPFAVINAKDISIMESDSKQSPRTGDNTLLWGVYAAGAAALIICAGYVLLRRKKHER